jgi:hypothetical protein
MTTDTDSAVLADPSARASAPAPAPAPPGSTTEKLPTPPAGGKFRDGPLGDGGCERPVETPVAPEALGSAAPVAGRRATPRFVSNKTGACCVAEHVATRCRTDGNHAALDTEVLSMGNDRSLQLIYRVTRVDRRQSTNIHDPWSPKRTVTSSSRYVT